MAIQDRLLEARFRGAIFFIEESETEGGRKQSTFEFINTGRRANQDLGLYRRKFEITAYIMGDETSYFARRNALLDALESPGSGELIHPFFGTETVTTGIYKLNESTRRLGYSTIKFLAEVVDDTNVSEQGDPAARPQDEVTVSQVSTTSQTAKDALASDLAEESSLIPRFPANLGSMESIIQNGLSQFNEQLGPIAENAQNAISWANGISGLVEDTQRLITNPTVLFSNVIDGITGVDGLTSNAIAASARLQNLFNYGSTDETNPRFTSSAPIIGNLSNLQDDTTPNNSVEFEDGVIVPKSREMRDRNRNAQIGVVMFQTSSLIEYLNQIARIEFTNTEEIDNVIETIETQFNLVSPQLSNNSLDSLSLLRDQVRILLNNRRINTNDISTINVQAQPLSILAYSLYGNTSQANNIVSLNNLSDTMEISGDVKVENNDSVRS